MTVTTTKHKVSYERPTTGVIISFTAETAIYKFVVEDGRSKSFHQDAEKAWERAEFIAQGRDVWYTTDNEKWTVITGIESTKVEGVDDKCSHQYYPNKPAHLLLHDPHCSLATVNDRQKEWPYKSDTK